MIEPDLNEVMRHGSHNGWTYKDFPQLVRVELWDWIMEQIGQENVRVLATTIRSIGGELWQRGQIVISDVGRERLAKAAMATAPGLDKGVKP